MNALVAAGLSLALLTTPALAQGKKSQTVAPDYSDAPLCDAIPDQGTSLICRCDDGPTSGSVWGSGPYTGDSSICTAARHAGVIGEAGGALQLVGLAGADSYEGSEANGVITSSWGSYGESFEVEPVPVATAMPDHSDAPVCNSVPDSGAVVCRCAAGTTGGSVWGSGPYTADSDICTAARHAGVIGEAGGALELSAAPGQDGYEGSQANGVTTSNWGSYGQSFAIRPVSAASATGPGPSGPSCDVIPGDAERFTCTCDVRASGSVWGSGPYTADSNICSAARHAGVLGSEGGRVTVMRLPGLAVYTGSQANGEDTADWGAYDASIAFDRN